MKNWIRSLVCLSLVAILVMPVFAQTYIGNERCQLCHASATRNQFSHWAASVHAKNNQVPNDTTMRSSAAFIAGQSVSMGSAYANAQVVLSKVGSAFFARVGAAGSNYQIVSTLGSVWKQRYLIRIDSSFYLLPIQWNLAGYNNNTTGTWVTYDPATWFNTDGTVKPINNAFRRKAWEKDCMGCHAAVGYQVRRTIVGNDTAWVGTWANSNSMLNMTVGCEYCHGPSSTHFGGTTGTLNPRNLANKDRKIELCGQCHIRTSSWRGAGLVGTYGYPYDELGVRSYKPGDTLSRFVNLGTAPNATGGMGTWPDLVTARQHRQQYQEYIGSGHYSNPIVEVTCFTCHAMHTANPNLHLVVDSLTVGANRFRVKNEDNTLCLSCHAGSGRFTSIQTAWVRNPVAFHDSIGRVVKQHSKHNTYDPLNTANTGGTGRCSICHMTKTAQTTNPYDIATHSFGVVTPYKTIQYQGVSTPSLGMLNSCSYPCHRNPSGSTAAVPTFGIGTDPTLTDWRQPTDVALADTLWRYWRLWGWTGVKEIAGGLPESYSLSQNYPNPFNPSTRINVDLSRRGNVRLTIYNVIGEEVATLMDGEYSAGKYEVTWNGRDGFGLFVASGVYFYKIDAGSFQQTKKMLLMK